MLQSAAYCILFYLVCLSTANKLDLDEKYSLTWSIDEDDIKFKVEVETTGWVGLGFSPNGGMSDSDIIVAWVESDGTVHVEDRYAKSNSLPVLDETDNLVQISGSEKDGITTIEFQRKLNTCDKKGDNMITSSTVRLIYAYGKTDPIDNILLSEDYHQTRRGAKSVYLLDKIPTDEILPSDSIEYDMAVSNYHIPGDDTTYYCAFQELPPNLNKEHHIVAIDTIITPENKDIVHHIVLYGCWDIGLEHLRGTNKKEGICLTPEMPDFEESCHATIYAWVVGGGKFYYPEHAGYLIGAEKGESPQFFLLEIHYNNPQHFQGRIDNTGIRITYTPTLRPQRIGNLRLGDIEGIIIPPRADKFRVVAYCHSSCTKSWIPKEGINVFAYMLHAHLLGVKIQLDWYRNGEAIEVMAIDETYDFNFQENRLFKEEKKVLPGDSFKLTCTLNSTARTTVTYGGLSAYDEMCLAFLMYYPRQQISRCKSLHTYTQEADNAFYADIGQTPNSNPDSSLIKVDYHTVLNGLEWNNDLRVKAQNAMDTSDLLALCQISAVENYPSDRTRFKSSDYQRLLEREKVADTCPAVDGARHPMIAKGKGDQDKGNDNNSSSTLLFSPLMFALSALVAVFRA